MKAKPPCRLFVLLARDAPVGVVLRRGPTAWTQLIRWRTDTDAFEPGQWFRGAIDFHRCDLSPSGERLLYFAKPYKRRSIDKGYDETWTALSRAPYFTALALWPLGDTWFGGGLFVDERRLRLNHPECNLRTHPDHPARNLKVVADPMMFWDRSVLSERMDRDGWTVLSKTSRAFRGRKIAGQYAQELEKADPKGRRVLKVLDLSDGLLNKRPCLYSVSYRASGDELLTFEAEWADWDQGGQLAYAAGGKLWRASFPPRGRTAQVREIGDFNGSRPDPQPSPEWARRW